MIRDVAIGIWFALVGLAFWGPIFGLPVPDMTAVYGVFLLTAVAALLLRLLRGEERGGKARG